MDEKKATTRYKSESWLPMHIRYLLEAKNVKVNESKPLAILEKDPIFDIVWKMRTKSINSRYGNRPIFLISLSNRTRNLLEPEPMPSTMITHRCLFFSRKKPEIKIANDTMVTITKGITACISGGLHSIKKSFCRSTSLSFCTS